MSLGLKWKFPLFLAVLLLFTTGVLSWLVLSGIKTNQREQMEESLQRQADVAEMRVKQDYLTGERLKPVDFMGKQGQELAVDLGISTNMRVILYDAKGQEVGNSLPLAEKPDVGDALSYALKGKIAYITEADSLIYLAPMQGPDGMLGVVQLHTSLKAQHEFYNRMAYRLVWTGGIVLLLSFILGFIYVYRQVRDIVKLKAEADRISRGEYPERSPLRRKDELGQLGTGILHMSRDIKGHMAALQEEKHHLQLAVEKLQALEQQQKQFINNVSHEFKTPLTSIQAYTDLLGMYGDDPQLIEEARSAIAKESERLYQLVEDVLRLSLLEKYDFESQAEEVELADLLQDVVSRISAKATKYDLTIQTDFVPVRVWGDRDHFIHIFMNLLDNAIKYNRPGGRIVIQSRASEDEVSISVRNTGRIIPREWWAHLFEPFSTLHQDRARSTGGTGLGLPLAFQLAEKQGGRLELVRSDAEETEFTVSFPRQSSREN